MAQATQERDGEDQKNNVREEDQEVGQKVDREQRFCLVCASGTAEDEHHFLFDCPAYYGLLDRPATKTGDHGNTDDMACVLLTIALLLSRCHEHTDDCSARLIGPPSKVIEAMQGLRMLQRSLTVVQRITCSVSQLPELRRWHADFVSSFAVRNAINVGSVPLRTFAAMPLSTDKERVVILGTGWAAARLTMDLDCKHFDITVRSTLRRYESMTCIYVTAFILMWLHVYLLCAASGQVVSPRNHMVFTPLLASACVGTLEFRSVAVPVMSLQKHLKEPQNNYLLGSAQNVDPEKKTVQCEAEDGTEFSVSYDKLVIATGSQVITITALVLCDTAFCPCIVHTPCKSHSVQTFRANIHCFDNESYCSRMQGSTFGIPGVEKYAHPLRDIAHANAIRNKLIANWSLANTPNRHGSNYAFSSSMQYLACEHIFQDRHVA